MIATSNEIQQLSLNSPYQSKSSQHIDTLCLVIPSYNYELSCLLIFNIWGRCDVNQTIVTQDYNTAIKHTPLLISILLEMLNCSSQEVHISKNGTQLNLGWTLVFNW